MVVVAHDKARGLFLDRPRRREAAGWHCCLMPFFLVVASVRLAQHDRRPPSQAHENRSYRLAKRRRKAGRVFLTTFLVTLGIIAFLILVQVI